MSNNRLPAAGLTALALLALAGALAAKEAVVPASAATAQTAAIAHAEQADTVSGWVVDANDWLDRGFLGVRHKAAAVASADLGEPLVILTDAGSIVYPVALSAPAGPMMDNVKLIPYAEQRIVVTGRFVQRGPERGIVINRITRAEAARRAEAFPVNEIAGAKVFGRVTALGCWLGRLDTGAARVRCTEMHAAVGEPLIVVDDSGDIYYPVVRDTATDPPDFTKLMKYLEQDVVVSGTVITRGRERAIAINNVAGYTPTETIRERDRK